MEESSYWYCPSPRPTGYAPNNTDCDDTDRNYHPWDSDSLAESCTQENAPDYNCDGFTGYADSDGDGVPACEDWADNDADRWLGHAETCDDKDNDCNGAVDDDVVTQVFYRDDDGDGYGVTEIFDSGNTCEIPGWSRVPGDCNDNPAQNGAAIHPGADEQCDGIDDNCVDGPDDGLSTTAWYEDLDRDGYGNSSAVLDACAAPDGYVAKDGDCVDDPLVNGAAYHPGAAEDCDSDQDFNCDGAAGEDDHDLDGRPACYDCNDYDPDVYGASGTQPASSEICDGKDNDCDGVADDVRSIQTLYRDADDDGYATDKPGTTDIIEVPYCPVGWAPEITDCDDSNAGIHPDAGEVCDGVDDNCDQHFFEKEVDDDADGVLTCESAEVAADCDDTNSNRSPLLDETCDGIDNDCDYSVDESATDAAAWYFDGDDDGYGDSRQFITRCGQPIGYSAKDGDCDDLDVHIHPDALEICDAAGVDENCNELVNGDDPDVDATSAAAWYEDQDGDGYGYVQVYSCDDPSTDDSSYVSIGGDCNDGDVAIHPNASESCSEAVDRNCDGQVQYADGDGDGVAACEDCDDDNGFRYPGALEICDADNVDEDCDLYSDNADFQGASGSVYWYPDHDGDGSGDLNDPGILYCDDPSSLDLRWSLLADDCDDARADVSPSRPESCDVDGVDENCNGEVNENGAAGSTTFYSDSDADGYGSSAGATVLACSAPAGYSADNSDCNDSRSDVFPNANEVCDSNDTDEDCDGLSDDGDNSLDQGNTQAWYADVDGDTYGGSSLVARQCDAGDGLAASSSDCDDSSAAVYPGAPEQCNDVDEDCDGSVDEEVTTLWYEDADGDGYGDPDSSYDGCAPPDGYVENKGDCDDANAAVHPGADDDLSDGEDSDCSDQHSDVYVSATLNDPDTDASVVKTITEAISIAPEGGTILVEAGRYVESLFFDQKNLIVRSVSGADATFIISDGKQGSTVRIKGGLLTLEGFTISGGTGMVGSSAADLCGHSSSSSERHGGSICGRDTTLTMSAMVLTGSSATYGGGLYLRDSLASITDSQWTGITGTKYGSGIYSRASDLSLEGVTFSGNTATSDGGGVYAYNSSLSMADCQFDTNFADGNHGGALFYSHDGTSDSRSTSDFLEVEHSQFYNGGATVGGGALNISSSRPVNLSSSSIYLNTALASGGGAYIVINAGVSLEASDLQIQDNTTNNSGGGLYLNLGSGSFANVTNLSLISNVSNADGGGLYLSSAATASHIQLVATDNFAGDEGGGIYFSGNSLAVIQNSRLENNGASNRGGGAYLSGGALEDVVVRYNHIDAAGGGGIYTTGSPVLTRVTVQSNQSKLDGAGLYVSSGGTYENMVISDNDAQRDGGGVYFSGSGGSFTNNTVANNRAWRGGGGVSVTGSAAPTLRNSIIAFNAAPWTGANFYYSGSSSSPTFGLSNSILYNPPEDGEATYGVSSFTLENYGLVQEDPQFIRDPRYGAMESHDFHLRGTSPAVDAGSSGAGISDPDGSPNDYGAFGGPDSSATDTDGDHLPDDWELSFFGEGQTVADLNPEDDPDGDNLTTTEEYERGLDPVSYDTDGDSFTDDQEIGAGTEPLDSLDIDLDSATANTVLISTTRADIQLALDRAFPGTHVQVAPGTYKGNLFIAFKPVTLESTEGSGTTRLQGDAKQSVVVIYAALAITTFDGFTVTGGVGIDDPNSSYNVGGGMDIEWSVVEVSNVRVTGNSAGNGGGIFSNSELTVVNTICSENVAYHGGGLYQEKKRLTIQNSRFDQNTATSYYGGGIYQSSCDSNLNTVVFDANYTGSYGGGMYISDGNSTIRNCAFISNEASSYGGAIHASIAAFTITNSLFVDNSASYGGAIYQYSSTATLANSIFALNAASSFPNVYQNGGTLQTSYNIYYTSNGDDGVNYSLAGTDMVQDPLLMPDDSHLQLSSPCVNAGDPTLFDPDGSRSDIGVYGGAGPDGFDLDLDGFPDYFWPGAISDAPDGYDVSQYDCDDFDPTVHECL